MSTRINKKFMSRINPNIQIARVGKHIVAGEPVRNGLRYRVEARGANADTAAALNSRIPITTFRKP